MSRTAAGSRVDGATELVSIVLIFLNGEPFLGEAIESVFAQTYPDWELLLVDDGSTDGSTARAREYTSVHPERVRYLEHPDHANFGMSVSRNLGIRQARGRYIAFLDADDLWLPEKLDRQLGLLLARPEASMVYGPAWMWHGWTGIEEDGAHDCLQDLRVPGGTVVPPPDLLLLFLQDGDVAPSPSGILARAEAVKRVGGFQDEFRDMYEDQAFYVKLALGTHILVSGECWYRYRHHPDSCCAVSFRTSSHDEARRVFLNWTLRYLLSTGISAPEVERAVRRELGKLEPPTGIRAAVRVAARMVLPTWARRWLRVLEDAWLGWRSWAGP